jgi:hypothetical protein
MSDPNMNDPDDDEGGDWGRLTNEEALAGIREGRRIMLTNAINLLESIPEPERRAIEAALEVLHEALANLDNWTEGMAIVLERSRQESLDLLQQH